MNKIFLILLFILSFAIKAAIPVVTIDPQPLKIKYGRSFTFSITATGTAPLTYQWQLNNSDLVGNTSSTLTVTSNMLYNEGNYRCIVTNGSGSDTSSNALLSYYSLLEMSRLRGHTLGCMITHNQITGADSTVRHFIDSSFDAVTLGEVFRFSYVCANKGSYDFNAADVMVNWAYTHNKKIRINPLIWSIDNVPSWIDTISNNDTVRQYMVNYIDTICKRYKGKIWQYDVINEIGSYKSVYLDTTFWERKAGPHFWKYAYAAARNADPSALLAYNDYAIEYSDDKDGSGKQYYELLKLMQADTTKLDILGWQSHYQQDTGDIVSNATFIKQANRCTALGYNITVTELDYRIPKSDADSIVNLHLQAQQYAALWKNMISSGITNIVLWGADDITSWINSLMPGWYKPCLWNIKNGVFCPKEAYYLVLKVLDKDTIINPIATPNQIRIDVNYTRIMSSYDTFPLAYNLSNIKYKKFWDSIKSDGTDIVVTNVAGDTLKSILSGFNKNSKMGLIEFSSTINDSTNTTYYLNFGVSSHTTPSDSIALVKSSIVCSPDFSTKLGNTLRDKCKIINLDYINHPDSLTIDSTDIGYAGTSIGQCLVVNGSDHSELQIANGSISFRFKINNGGIVDNAFVGLTSQASNIGNGQEAISDHTNQNKITQLIRYNDATISNNNATGYTGQNDSLWHYCMITWDTIAAHMYVDGSITGTAGTSLGDMSFRYNGSIDLRLFTNMWSSNFCKGSMNFVRLYNKVLTNSYRSTEYNMLQDNSNFWITSTIDTVAHIDSITPIHGVVGTSIKVYGSNFGDLPTVTLVGTPVISYTNRYDMCVNFLAPTHIFGSGFAVLTSYRNSTKDSMPFSYDLINLTRDTTFLDNSSIDSFSIADSITIRVAPTKTLTLTRPIKLDGSINKPITFKSSVNGSKFSLSIPKTDTVEYSIFRDCSLNVPIRLSNIYSGNGNNINIKYMPFDELLLSRWFKQDDTIRVNYLKTNIGDSIIFNKSSFVRDSLVYGIGSLPLGKNGSYMESVTGYPLIVKLNGIRYTPVVKNHSIIKWR